MISKTCSIRLDKDNGDTGVEDFSQELSRAKAGDQEALARLFDAHAAGALRAARRRLGPMLRRHYDSVDVTQSVFSDVMKEIGQFEDRGEAAFRRWLEIKAESKVRRKYRKHLRPAGGRREGTLPTLSSPDESPGPATSFEREEEAARVRRALESLEDRDREVIHLRSDEELSHAEVATRLGLPSADAARKLYARALIRLTEQWKTA